jgi:RNA polymerase sigma factor (TIGR02999 family)
MLTALLLAWKQDHDLSARDRLFELVEKELTTIAGRALADISGLRHKIEPRELVSELYLRLADHPALWENRHLFYGMVRKVMRNILLDLVKRDEALKRPPSSLRMGEEALDFVPSGDSELAIGSFYRALDRLEGLNAWHAQAIELHYLMGVTVQELADFSNVPFGTVKRDLKTAKAWLKVQLAQS